MEDLNMGLQRDFDHIRFASGVDSRLTPTIEDIMKSFYVEKNYHYQDDLTFKNFRNSHEVIESIYQDVVDYIGYDAFNFSDDANVNDKLVHDFWVTFFTRNYYKAINYETFDMFASTLYAKLMETMPLYNELIKKRLTDLWVTHDTQTTGSNESNATNNASSNSKSVSDGTDNTTANGTSSNEHHNAFSDTPQNKLSISASSADYATTVTGDVVDGSTSDERHDATHGETTNNSSNNSTGNVTGKNDGTATGRDFDVFVMTQNWVTSGYGVWLDIFDKLDAAGLFSRVMPTSKGRETQDMRPGHYLGYRWFI